jgi:hypothetical protein
MSRPTAPYTDVARNLEEPQHAAHHTAGGRPTLAAGRSSPGALTVDHLWASELLGAYALSACNDIEAAALELHLLVCPDCADEAAGFRDVVERLDALKRAQGGSK